MYIWQHNGTHQGDVEKYICTLKTKQILYAEFTNNEINTTTHIMLKLWHSKKLKTYTLRLD